jgi:surface protein
LFYLPTGWKQRFVRMAGNTGSNEGPPSTWAKPMSPPRAPPPAPPRVYTPITDANFKAAIKTCLVNPYRVTGLCEDSEYGSINNWDTSKVTNMANGFNGQPQFNGDISRWDTSKVTNMNRFLMQMVNFNADISGWDTSQVTDMSFNFYQCDSIVDISKWNTAKVTDMSNIFMSSKFNGDIGGWDTSSVTTMNSAFSNTAKFNSCGISKWDTSQVEDMALMFHTAKEFNCDISGWNVAKVNSVQQMFMKAAAFDQDITGWKTPLAYTPTRQRVTWQFQAATAWLKKYKRIDGQTEAKNPYTWYNGPQSLWTRV